jgi:Fe-S cluster assembly protein SufD
VHVFGIDPATGGLSPHSTAPLAESFPYLSLDREGRRLFAASYGAHLVSVNEVGSDGRVVPEPLQVTFVNSGRHPALVSPRLVIAVGEHAQVSVVETYADVDRGGSLANAVTDVLVGPSAIVDHVKYQRQDLESFHLATMFVRLARAATFTSHSLVLGGRITRNDLIATLDGEGAECTLNGLYVASGDSLVDNHTTIDHAKAHCPSHEVYKGILAGRAKD